jgi:hypothetical protein
MVSDHFPPESGLSGYAPNIAIRLKNTLPMTGL